MDNKESEIMNEIYWLMFIIISVLILAYLGTERFKLSKKDLETPGTTIRFKRKYGKLRRVKKAINK